MHIFPIIQALTFAICKIEHTSYKATCVRVANLKNCQNSLTYEKKVSIIGSLKGQQISAMEIGILRSDKSAAMLLNNKPLNWQELQA